MPPRERRIGAHLPLAAGMVKAAERAREIGATTLQVFADNPTAWRRREEPSKELPAFRRRLAQLDIAPVAIHASYLVNLAGPDDDFFAKSVATLAEELRVAPAFSARLVNVHIGSHRGTGLAAGVERVAAGVAQVMEEVPDAPDAARLVLENSAGGGFGIGSTVEELGAILDAIARRGVPDHRVGICLDTAHLWGAGVDISTSAGVDALVAGFEARIGLDRLAMIHLNDSKAELGSHQDRHQHVGAGRIGAEGMGAIVRHSDLAHVAYLIETPGMDEGYDAINIARIRELAAGRPLPELPPEALNLPGSRSRIGTDRAAAARKAG